MEDLRHAPIPRKYVIERTYQKQIMYEMNPMCGKEWYLIMGVRVLVWKEIHSMVMVATRWDDRHLYFGNLSLKQVTNAFIALLTDGNV